MEGQTVSQVSHLCLSESGLQGITGPLCVVVGLQSLLDARHPGEGHLKALHELLLRHGQFWAWKWIIFKKLVGTIKTRRHSFRDLSCNYCSTIDPTFADSTAFNLSQTMFPNFGVRTPHKGHEMNLRSHERITGRGEKKRKEVQHRVFVIFSYLFLIFTAKLPIDKQRQLFFLSTPYKYISAFWMKCQ